jgi:hypothetical protein
MRCAPLKPSRPGFAKALATPAGPALAPEQVGLAYWGAAAWAAHISLSKDQPDLVADLPLALRLAQLAWGREPGFGDGDLASLMGTLEMARPGGQRAQLRIGTVVPKNSTHHQLLLELGEGWRAAQGAGAKVVVFTDGSQGGETDMARRMRIGQLQGALLSVVGLREIEPSIAALQSMPLLFRSWDEVDHVREKMRPAMEKRFPTRASW